MADAVHPMLGHPDAPALDFSGGSAPTPPLILPSAPPIFASDSTQMGVDPSTPNPVTRVIGALGKQLLGVAMAPGQAYQSTQPITTDQMIKPGADLAGLVTLGAGAAPAEADALRMGIKAYHGSPHDFDVFDASKIGTGEGAQAYGHGLYFAGNEGTAQSYRDALSQPAIGGLKFNELPISRNSQQVLNRYADLPNLDAVKAEIQKELADSRMSAVHPAMQKALDEMKDMSGEIGRGRMYEVNINADPSQFLDWDKPLDQQPAGVQEAFKKVGIDANDPDLREKIDVSNGLRLHPPSGGSTIYPQEIPQIKGPAAANFLRGTGVPGIKYLDQGSRASGEGSRNYVVFDPSIINILRKYGLAGLPFAGTTAPIFAPSNNSGDKS